jgi:hypothetical protein
MELVSAPPPVLVLTSLGARGDILGVPADRPPGDSERGRPLALVGE